MQSPELTFKIEIFGTLIEQLNYWHLMNEDEGIEVEYVEERFMEMLRAVRDMREVLLDDLTRYLDDCKDTGTPIDLSYYRIKKQLDESTFELLRS